MPEENYRKIKLLKIMEILRQETDEEHQMTKVELAARLVAMNVSCSPRSLIRDIKLLNEQGYEIMERLIGHEKGYFVCDRSFSVPELKILIDAVQAASFVTEKKTAALVDKIAALGGSRFRRRADSRFKSKLFARSALKAGVRIPAGAPKKTDGLWGTLRKEGAPGRLLYLSLISSWKRCNPCGYAVFSLLRSARCCWKASSISSGINSWSMPTPL